MATISLDGGETKMSGTGEEMGKRLRDEAERREDDVRALIQKVREQRPELKDLADAMENLLDEVEGM